MIELKDLLIATNEPLIIDAKLVLKESKIYGLTAPNGSGKSTLLRTLSGLLSAKDGHTYFFDEQCNEFFSIEMKKRLFYFENSTWLDGNLTGLDYLQLINQLWQADKKLIQESILYWRLVYYVNKPIKKYSLGMKQKNLLSLYTVRGARFWLLDEPTLALDKKSVELLADYLLLAKKRGNIVLFSSHVGGDEIFKICNHIISIENKRLWIDGGAEIE